MNYAKIKHWDVANGEGIRISLFVSGCKFHCKGCFNEETWDYSYGNKFTIETFNELKRLISNDNISGLSLLGGDPMWQDDDGLIWLRSLCDYVHSINKNVWLWTGFTFEQIMNKGSICQIDLLKSCDVIVDGQFDYTKRNLNLQWCGSENQRVIDVKKSLKENKVILYRTA